MKLRPQQPTRVVTDARPHETLYQRPSGDSVSAPMAVLEMAFMVLLVKWAYPTDRQLNDLSVIQRGVPKFKGEELLVKADESYESYLARTAGYKAVLRLVGQDRDLCNVVLAGLGVTETDMRVKAAVQAQLVPLTAKERTSDRLARLITQAKATVDQAAEAERQVKLQQLAARHGLYADPFGVAGSSASSSAQQPRLRPADIRSGLRQPEGGWGSLWPAVKQRVGAGPGDLCIKHTIESCKRLHTNAECKDQQRPAAAAFNMADLAQILQQQQLLQHQHLLQQQPASAMAADASFKATSGPVRQPSISNAGGAAATQQAPQSPRRHPQCNTCGRFHVGECYGPNMEHAPPGFKERTAKGQGAAGGSQPASPRAQQSFSPRAQQQAAAAFAGVDMYPADVMHPASQGFGYEHLLLQPPRADSYAAYDQLGGYVPTDDTVGLTFVVEGMQGVCSLPFADQGELNAKLLPDVCDWEECEDDADSCCSYATACNSFSVGECDGLGGLFGQGLPAVAALSPSLNGLSVVSAGASNCSSFSAAAFSSSAAPQYAPLQEPLPRSFAQTQLPALTVQSRRSSRLAARSSGEPTADEGEGGDPGQSPLLHVAAAAAAPQQLRLGAAAAAPQLRCRVVAAGYAQPVQQPRRVCQLCS